MTRAEVKRRVMAQLGAVLVEERPNRGRTPVNPLTDMSFVTRPRATMVPALCRIDRLTVLFRSREPRASGPDTPVSVDGFAANHYFHFAAPPPGPYFKISDHEGQPNETACARAELWKDEFFSAPDEETATDGYLVTHRVLDAIVAGSASFGFACNKWPSEKGRDCIDIVRELQSEHVSSIDSCDSAATDEPGARCYEVFVGERSLRIVVSPIAFGGNAAPPLTVRRVELESPILLVHERVD